LTRSEVTAVTNHPAWGSVVEIVQDVEDEALGALRLKVDPIANQHLILLATLKSRIQTWSDKENIWKLPPPRATTPDL
jgi:hypothetical protein